MRGRNRFIIIVASFALVAAACGNSDSGSTDNATDNTERAENVDNGQVSDAHDDEFVAVDQPGVTDDTITVSSVASTTNPLGGKYGTINDGVLAYFAMVNDEGGIYQRQLELPEDNQHDDQLANNQQEVQQIITQDDPFAVVGVATLLFQGADLLVDEGIPTFGWNINAEWQNGPNLYGQTGSYLNFTGAAPGRAFAARELDRHKVGVLAYNVPQSSDCLEGYVNTFEKYGPDADAEVVFSDDSLAFGVTDLSVQVQQMKDAGVDLVGTCMDTNGVITLAREMKRQNLDAIQFLPNGYDYDLLHDFGDLFQGSLVRTDFVPLEFEPHPEGIQEYLDWMDQTGGDVNEISLSGWIDARMFVEGLRAAGPDFTREKVIDGLNQLTDFNADGAVQGVDWTIAHTGDPELLCDAYVTIEGDEFVPALTKDDKPFVCLPRDGDNLPDEAEHRS